MIQMHLKYAFILNICRNILIHQDFCTERKHKSLSLRDINRKLGSIFPLDSLEFIRNTLFPIFLFHFLQFVAHLQKTSWSCKTRCIIFPHIVCSSRNKSTSLWCVCEMRWQVLHSSQWCYWLGWIHVIGNIVCHLICHFLLCYISSSAIGRSTAPFK